MDTLAAPSKETVAAMDEKARRAGKTKYIGLSEVLRCLLTSPLFHKLIFPISVLKASKVAKIDFIEVECQAPDESLRSRRSRSPSFARRFALDPRYGDEFSSYRTALERLS
jgi:hypothetical protein